MSTSTNTLLVVFAFMMPVIAGSPGVAGAQVADTVATGLNGPMGVLVAEDGSLWVVDSGVGGDMEMQYPDLQTYELKTVKYGETARIFRYAADGSHAEIAHLPSFVAGPGEVIGGARLAVADGVVYATSGVWSEKAGDEPKPAMASVVKIVEGKVVEVANAYPVERDTNPDGYLVDSNPFGLVVGPDDHLWVTDSAGNTVLRIDRETGDLEVVATFGGVPSPLPNRNRADKLESDPVPTGLAFDASGNLYVALLPGFPFLPGSSKVVRVGEDGTYADYATGLTMLVDLRMGPDGELYGVSVGRFTEQGPQPNSGAVLRIHEGEGSEELLSGLSFPTSIDFAKNGDAYVTVNGVGAPGSGGVVAYRGLASSE